MSWVCSAIIDTGEIRLRTHMADRIRIDKWLWAARFYKTRSLAADEIGKGRVFVNEQLAKPSREVGVGDLVSVRKEDPPIHVRVAAISGVRGPAPVARQLYEETPESVAARERAAEMRRLAPEPAQEITAGRPTKRDRRLIDLMRGK
jgi:ribosome-associated heat shock protein Hsp15